MSEENLTTEELLAKLRKALQEGGDFPASARVVNQLRLMIRNPNATANQLSEIILQEPSLGMRILHLVNSSFYRRSKPITTVSQAVVQIGLRPLAELCSGLILLQKFVPRARQNSPFASCLKQNITKSLMTATLTAELTNDGSIKNEQGFLVGSLACLGTLLLGYYFPKIYASIEKRAQEKNIDIAQSVKEITGLSTYELSNEVLSALQLPDFFQSILDDSSNVSEGNQSDLSTTQDELKQEGGINISPISLSKAVYAAQEIGEAFSDNVPPERLVEKIDKVYEVAGIDIDVLYKSLDTLSSLFTDQCQALELKLPLPKNLSKYVDEKASRDKGKTDVTASKSNYTKYFAEIEKAIENREPTATIVTTVMEALKVGLKFNKVLLMLRNAERTHLEGRIMLGKQAGFDPKKFKRSLNVGRGVIPIDIVAFKEGQAVFTGEPIVGKGWPIAAIPIGTKQSAIGVIYVEDEDSGSDEEMAQEKKDAINQITNLLKKSLLGKK